MRASSGIIAGPRWGFPSPGNNREVRARLMAQARVRHQAELGAASSWRRLWMELTLRREVRAELKRIFPADALYAFRGAR